MKKLLLPVIVGTLVVLAWLKQEIYAHGKMPAEAVVLVNKGSGSAVVAQKLADSGVIRYPLVFKIAARLKGLDKNLKAGEYLFAPNISMAEVISQMARGDVLYRRLTLPEGLTSAQMLSIIRDNEFLGGEISQEVEEGSLLPETYNFSRGDSRDSIVAQAQAAMQKALSEVWQNRDEYVPVKNAKELLVLASIVEKETGVPEERPLVASVFVNRLRKGMRLQTDPTVIYALTNGQDDLGRALTRKDLQVDSPYNTYKYSGLPPKPICNPGRAALEAVAHPEMSNYLYFVASGNGGHNFAVSLNEHNRNVSSWKKQKQK